MCKHFSGHFSLSIIFVIIISISIIQAQVDTLWTKTFGGSDDDYSFSVQQTKDGGYILMATSQSFGAGSQDFWLIKTNPNGDTLWTKKFGENADDWGYSAQQTIDEGYIVTGITRSFNDGSNYDLWLIKTNSSGDTLWTKTFRGNCSDVTSVQQTTDEGYIIIGSTYSFIVGSSDIWLIKTNANGDTLWTKTYGGSGDDYGHSVQQTKDEGFIITGYTQSFGAGSNDIWLVKTNAEGDTLWTKTFGGSDSDFGNSVQQTKDEGYIVVGTAYSLNGGNVWLIKTDASGNSIWTKMFVGSHDDGGGSVQQTKDEGYIVTGNTSSFGAGIYDVWLIKTNANGDTLWTKTFGGSKSDGGNSVQQTIDGGYIITGATYSYGAGMSDVWLIKTTPDTITTKINKFDGLITLKNIELEQNYPNPFNPKTTFKFSIPKSDQVAISFYTISGQIVESKTMYLNPGIYSYEFDGSNYSTGIYFYKISTSSGFIAERKMVLLK